MEKVIGIGGVFFKAGDPKKLSEWYEIHLGVTEPPESYDLPVWEQTGGETMFAPMPHSSTRFSKEANLYINFRVRDLEAMCQQLNEAGIETAIDSEIYPNGVFASLEDPEGNQIQLWEPR